MKTIPLHFLTIAHALAAQPYTIVDTNQDRCFDSRGEMSAPKPGQPDHGQDAQFSGHPSSYVIRPDGLTVLDNQTGLIWQRLPETNHDGTVTHADKLTWEEALQQPAKLNAAKFAGHTDWRLPTIKELYSLFDARGTDPSLHQSADTSNLRPFLDSKTFPFIYGDTANGARVIDSQYGSATQYVGKSPRGGDKVFGVNFADGRIKGYDQSMPGGSRKFRFFILCVRGNPAYGKNDFKDNNNGTVTDRATGLIWTKADSGKGMDWTQALAYAAEMNANNHLGHNDWRVPNIKELQSLVDYSRSPDTSGTPALDPVFQCTSITNEAGQKDWPFYWSSTTHIGSLGGAAAMYVAFGRAGGFLSERSLAGGPPSPGQGGPGVAGSNSQPSGPVKFVDVHGAGAQRSDPKTGDPQQFPRGRGPQGDVVRINNFVRLVRGGDTVPCEVKSTPASPPAVPTAPVGQPGAPAGLPGASPLVTALDKNHNGIIEAGEIANATQALKALDKNGDGKLTQEEFRPAAARGGFPPPPMP